VLTLTHNTFAGCAHLCVGICKEDASGGGGGVQAEGPGGSGGYGPRGCSKVHEAARIEQTVRRRGLVVALLLKPRGDDGSQEMP